MKVLFDTNVIIDIFSKNSFFFFDSYLAFDICAVKQWQTCIAVTAVPDIEYLLSARKILPKEKVAQTMNNLFELFSVVDTQECDCLVARQSGLPDFEDALISASARRNGVDCIITRNIKDFLSGSVTAMTPADFVATYKPKDYCYTLLEE